MATIYNMAGTTSHTFTLGDGTTIFYGIANPIDSMGKVGDIYIAMNKKLSNENDYDDVASQQELNNFPADYQQEEGHALPVGYIVRLVENEVSTYYKWNGSSWDELFNDNDPLGRIYYKEAFEDGSRWNFIKSYSFDDDIIHAVETSLNSNDFKIALESADNSGIVSSTKANDYEKNHSAYGVTRFAVTNETYAGNSGVDKFIVETPAQIKADINVEKTRAEGAEQNLQNQIGDLSQLTTPAKTSLVASDNSLQEQIDTIVSKSDVVDLVGTYAELMSYDTHDLADDDVIKVLQDETNSEATTYYRFTPVPTTPNVSVATKAALDAYPTTSLSIGNVAKVTADETHSGQEAYYVWRKLNGTPSWIYSGPCDTSVPHTSGKYYWDRIGEEGPFYTKSESDGRFVHLTGDEIIEGKKTFKNFQFEIRSEKFELDNPDPDQTNDFVHLGFQDMSGTELGHIKNEYLPSTQQLQLLVGAKRTVNGSSIWSSLRAGVNADGTVYTLAEQPDASSSKNINDKNIATISWVNDPEKSLNVVHRDGNETITGTKTMTGATVLVATQSPNDNSTKAASTAYVDALIKVPAFTASNNGQYLGVETNPSTQTTSLVWKSADNIALNNITDVTITSPTSGQVLVYDSTLNSNAGGWKNGSQVTATIKYW